MQFETSYDYRIERFKARVYSGRNALSNLPAEIRRQKARRAFIICGSGTIRMSCARCWRRAGRRTLQAGEPASAAGSAAA